LLNLESIEFLDADSIVADRSVDRSAVKKTRHDCGAIGDYGATDIATNGDFGVTVSRHGSGLDQTH